MMNKNNAKGFISAGILVPARRMAVVDAVTIRDPFAVWIRAARINGVSMRGIIGDCEMRSRASSANDELTMTYPRAPAPQISKIITPACFAPKENPAHRFA